MRPSAASSPRAVLFDLYGTLAYVRKRDYESAVARMARVARVGCTEFRAAWESFFRAAARGDLLTTEERARATLVRLRRPANQDLIARIGAIEEQFQQRAVHLYPDARSTLRRLRAAGFRLAIVTNSPPSVLVGIQRLKLRQEVDVIVLSHVVRACKPSPEPYRAACRALRVPPRRAVFVGDGTDDELTGAQAVGMLAVGIARRTMWSPRLDGADGVRIWRLSALSALLLKRAASPAPSSLPVARTAARAKLPRRRMRHRSSA